MVKNNLTRGNGLLEDFLAKKRANIASKLISKRSKKDYLLDIGCGTYPYFLINSQSQKKYGLDPNIDSNLLRNKSIVLKKINVEEEKLPFKDNFFDIVTMLAVFEHINGKNLQFVLREISRVLKKDGILVITTPAPWVDWLLHLMGKIGLISKEEIEDHKHNHDNIKIREILSKAGFKRSKIKSGFFEFKMNMWFTAYK